LAWRLAAAADVGQAAARRTAAYAVTVVAGATLLPTPWSSHRSSNRQEL